MKNRKQFVATIALITSISILFVVPEADAQRRRAVGRHIQLGSLSGVVTDAASGEPLAGAEVRIEDSRRTTNSKGEYAFENLAAGTWSVTADRWGYKAETREVQTSSGPSTADFALELAPYVTLTRSSGETERYSAESVEFGYALPFTGTVSSTELTVCTGDPDAPIVLERGSIARIQGPAVRVESACCDKSNGERVTIERKSGEVFDAVILDSCPPYNMYFIGRNLDSGNIVYRRLSETTSIEFPE
ncbi:MAG: carboxypeptidase-like regulatory domain-containing protein [Acidobacteria bacterium]|nr:carboxypeptidase-like regulatory domain-containing protein [Acidobacteriota bacterium]